MKNSVNILGIFSIILGLIGICFSCMVFGGFPALLGIILGIIGLTIFKNGKFLCITGIILSTIGFIFSIVVFVAITTNSENQTETTTNDALESTTEIETTAAVESTVEITTEKPVKEETTIKEIIPEATTETQTQMSELSEEDYKSQCKEMYYDDVFFGDNLSKGDFVKLHLMVSENYYFKIDSLYSNSFSEIMDKWELHRDFKKCSVLRKEENIYAGVGKIDLYFSNKYECIPDNYDLGDKITIYGEVISFYKDDWDGFNDVIIIPKYIENNK